MDNCYILLIISLIINLLFKIVPLYSLIFNLIIKILNCLHKYFILTKKNIIKQKCLFTINKKVKKTASFRSSIVPLNLKPNALLILFYIFIMKSVSVCMEERERKRERDGIFTLLWWKAILKTITIPT
jgi:hypothetical protein